MEAISIRAYARSRREREAAAEADLEAARIEHLDVDAVFAFAEHVLTNAARL